MDYLNMVADECRLRGYSRQTVKAYVHHIRDFLGFLDKSRFNLNNGGVKYYLLAQEMSVNSMRLKYAALSFFFQNVLKKPFTKEEIPVTTNST
jgi:site-specific recombinase XerD